MSDLTEFLLARIAEDEAQARAAAEYLRIDAASDRSPFGASYMIVGGPFEPSRVLAECEAKRRIVERAARALRWIRDPEGAPAERVADWAWATLEDLAMPYADHPDCREEWRP